MSSCTGSSSMPSSYSKHASMPSSRAKGICREEPAVRLSQPMDATAGLRPQEVRVPGSDILQKHCRNARKDVHAAAAARRGSRSERGSRNERAVRQQQPQDDEIWLGPEPEDADADVLEGALRDHREMHTVEDAFYSVQRVYDLLKDMDSKNVIPNKNAMQIFLQHCCLKSASFCAEELCFKAANYALTMMEKQKCRFDIATVVQIVLQISLRASLSNIEKFVCRLVTLTNLSENAQSFQSRHLTYALAERKASVDESLNKAQPFAEKGLKIDWKASSAQEFHIYNVCEGGRKFYEPVEGYGFSRKGSFATLSMEAPNTGGYEYNPQRDGAIVEIYKASDGECLVVKMRTQVIVPFQEGVAYRLQDMDIADLQTKRMAEALRILGKDSNPQYARLCPDSYLCEMLSLPPERPYRTRLMVRRKDAQLDEDLDFHEYATNEPIRVRSIGLGALLEWNRANPTNPIHVGDRVVKVKGDGGHWISDKEGMLEEIRDAHTWTKYELHIVFMRKVKFQDHSMEVDCLLPNAEDTENIILREEESLRKKLNPSQVEALRVACTRQLSLVQGPPGTGKTTTSVELLCFLLDHHIVPTPILVSGHTNAAVDNILVGLAKKGKRVVRIGDEDKVRMECKPYVLGGDMAAQPGSAEVICATCIASGNSTFQKEGIKCHTVLIDEASQATETSCLVPLCRAAQQLILVGDQCQLQPFVKSELAKSEDLGLSLFNRFCQQGVTPTMLDTQYRMHPSICEFPSGAFYNNLLLSHVQPADRMPTKYWQWPSRAMPVSFVDAKHGAESEGKTDKKNEAEVALVVSALKKILQDPELCRASDDGTYPVGIVTPYAAQKERIMSELEKEGSPLVDAKGKLLVEVNSVDGFQGREKEIIIFSAVRSNAEGEVGFLHDWRRINVMLTRAKRGLLVIGNRATLQTDYFWRNWLRWAASRGCIMGQPSSGSWVSKCVVEEEWVMKPRDHTKDQALSGNLESACDSTSVPHSKLAQASSKDVVSARESLKPSMEEVFTDSWEELAMTPKEGANEKSSADAFRPIVDSWDSLAATPDQDGVESTCSESMFDESTAEDWEEFSYLSQSSAQDREGDQELLIAMNAQEETVTNNVIATESVCAPVGKTASVASISEATTLEEFAGNDSEKELANSRSERELEAMMASIPLERLTTANFLDSSSCDQCIANEITPHSTDYFAQCTAEDVAATSLNAPNAVNGFFPYNSAPTSVPAPSITAVGQYVPQDPAQLVVPVQHMNVFTCGIDAQGNMVWMPMVVPVYDSGYHMRSAMMGGPSESALYSAPSVTSNSSGSQPWVAKSSPLESQSRISLARQQNVDQTFNDATGAHSIAWHADAKQLQGKNRQLVSPPFELKVWPQQAASVFKLMIHPKGNSFKKSRGLCHIKLKCESDLPDDVVDATIKFSVRVGGDVRGPFLHNFLSHSIAELQKGQQDWNILCGTDAASNAIPIFLEVHRCEVADVADKAAAWVQQQESTAPQDRAAYEALSVSTVQNMKEASEADVGLSTDDAAPQRANVRSEAGRLKQRERHMRRLRQRVLSDEAEEPAIGSSTDNAEMAVAEELIASFHSRMMQAEPIKASHLTINTSTCDESSALDAALFNSAEAMSEDMSTHVSDDEDASEQAWSEIQDGDEEYICEGPLDRLQASLRKQHGYSAFSKPSLAHEGPLDRLETMNQKPSPLEQPASRRSWAAVAGSVPSCQESSQHQPSLQPSSHPVSLREEMQALAASIKSSRALAHPQRQRAQQVSR